VIPISKPLLTQEERDAVIEVLDSGMLIQGKRVSQFEEEFAEFCGVQYAIATSSGTTALQAAFMAHGVSAGDEVITTPFTFIASANAIQFVGARPVFVDIRPDTYALDPDQIEAAITERTRAILPVHLYGCMADMPAIMDIASRHELAVIEDACQAHGAGIGDRKAGSFTTGCFSFYPSKNITTGEGGIITTNDANIARRCRLIRNHGMDEQYLHEMVGYNFRMTDLQAAIGLVQMGRLAEFNAKRIANAAYLTKHLEGVVAPAVPPNYRHVFHQYTIRVPDGRRDELSAGLTARGIASRVYYPLPVHQQPYYQRLGYNQSLPEAERASEEVLSLPVHPSLTADELASIAEAVNDIL
jgi:perosamine synthetase